MHYYDFALCDALVRGGKAEPILFTCDETAVHAAPPGVPVRYAFRGIYGEAPALLRGVRYARAWREITAAAKREQPQIAHLHYFLFPPADWLAVQRLRHQGVRIVITAHDVIPFNVGSRSLLPSIFRSIYGSADRIIVHAQHNRRELLQHFPVDEGKVAVIPHGHYLPYTGDILLDRATARAKLDVADRDPILLFFGQIKRVKGLDVLLKAMPQVITRYPNVLLLIAGQVWKDDWGRYQAIIDGLGLIAHVHARLEHIPDEDVEMYYRAADVVVLPYRHIYQSGVLLMTYSYARPVVASQVGGIAEVVRDGETGLLVPPDDPQALAVAVNRLLADRETADAMGVAGRELVEAECSWERIAVQTTAVYEEIA